MVEIKNDVLTERIIGCAITVNRTLGAGFLEKVYERALCIELRDAGLYLPTGGNESLVQERSHWRLLS